MFRTLSRMALVACAALAVAGCATSSAPSALPGAGTAAAPAAAVPPGVPNIAGVYNGTVTERSSGRSIHAKLKISLRQTGDKFTGIFDMILKTVQDQFPIIHGVVTVVKGKTILHFIIEGSPRNAKAVATVAGTHLHGKAKVPAKGGPAVYFTYSATKA